MAHQKHPYGAWSLDSPTLQDQYFEEFFDEYDPATRFDSCGPTEQTPWQAPPPGFAPPDPVAREEFEPLPEFEAPEFDSSEFEAPGYEALDRDPPSNSPPPPDGPGGAPMHGHPIHCTGDSCRRFAGPMVRPMSQGFDGVYRASLDPQTYYGHKAPVPEPSLELSPYTSLPISSAFSIKGDECSCESCQCGGS